MSIKKYLLIFAVAIAFTLGLGFAFYEKGVQLYLFHAIKSTGCCLTYQEIQTKPGQITLIKPDIRFAGNKNHLQAETLEFAYQFSPFSRNLRLEISLFGSELNLHSGEIDLQPLFTEIAEAPSWIKGWINIQGRLKNQNGILKLGDKEDYPPLSFNIDHSWGNTPKAAYVLEYQDAQKNKRLDFKWDSSGGKLSAKEIDLAILSDLIHALLPAMSDWSFSKGILEGDLTFSIADGEFNQGEGELLIQEASAFHKASNIKADIKEVTVKANPEVGVLAAMDFSNGRISFSDNELYGMMRGLKGKVLIGSDKEVSIQSEGIWSSDGQNSYASLEAKSEASFNNPFLKIKLSHLEQGHSPSLIQFQGKNWESKTASAEIEFTNVRQREFGFAQRLLDNTSSQTLPLRYVSGDLTAAIHLDFQDQALSAMSVNNIKADKCFLLIKPWELAAGADELSGHFSMDFTDLHPHDSINAEINVSGGQLALAGINPSLWHFTDIETRLEVKNGALQTSSGSVQLAGLKGKADISSERICLELSGKALDLKPFMPERMHLGIEESFTNDTVVLKAHIDRISHGINVEGELAVQDSNLDDLSRMSFGFKFDRAADSLSGPYLEQREQCFHHILPAHISQLAPITLSPIISAQHAYLQKEIGYSGFTLKEGWLFAPNVDLNKMASPFFFPHKELILRGTADIEGTFDLNGLTLNYGASFIQIENDALSLEIPSIGEKKASYHLDLASQADFSTIPIENGSYFDKSTGLLFTNIQTTMILEGKKIHATELETFSNGIYYAGSIDVDYSSPEAGAVDVFVHANTLEGTFVQAQAFFNHFDKPFFFTKIPIDGHISFAPGGAELFFGVRETELKFSSKVHLYLSEGFGAYPQSNFSIHDLGLSVFHDSDYNALAISDIQGTLLIGDVEKFTEYALEADKIHFTDWENNEAQFDISVKSPQTEVVRIAGKTKAVDPKNPASVEFHFDPDKTHFGAIFPKTFDLALTDWSRVEHLNLQFESLLSSILHDVQNLYPSGLPFFSADNFKEVHNIKSGTGTFASTLSFDGSKGVFSFNIAGNEVSVEEYHFKEVNLSGYKRENRWVIEQLQLDPLSLSAELLKIDDFWKVDFLGLSLGKSILVGLSGSYKHGDPVINANVNLLEVDFSALRQWDYFQNWFGEILPKGKLKGNGNLVLTQQNKGGWAVGTLLETSLKDFSINETRISDISNLSIHYQSNKGFTLQNVNGKILSEPDKGDVAIDLAQFSYDFAQDSYQILGLNFEADAKRLPWISKVLHTHLSSAIDEKVATLIRGLKTEGTLKGTINSQTSPHEKSFEIALADGKYHFLDMEEELKDLLVSYQEDELKVSALSSLSQQPVWFSVRFNPALPDRGSMLLADTAPSEVDKPALILQWKNDPKGGLIIEKARGYLAGLNVDLSENSTNPTNSTAFHLTGTVDVNGSLVKNVVPSFLAETLTSLGIGKGYQLKGEFSIEKEAPLDKESSRDFRFFGMLTGNNIELKGYQFKQLTSHVVFEPHSLQIYDLTLSDIAINMHIGNIKLDKRPHEQWVLNIPLVSVYEMRPSLLKEVGKDLPKQRKPLVIDQLLFQNISGIVGDEKTYRGTGTLHFLNPPKKYQENFLFKIPKEILTRIGLNLSVLTPVTGTAHFEIKQDKLILTKLKDVYSDGKISKFYLPNSGSPATIDFDGNITNMQIRFKQSTLLLKLAELFTINVQGSLSNPSYSLQRQKYFIKNEEIFSSTDLHEKDTITR